MMCVREREREREGERKKGERERKKERERERERRIYDVFDLDTKFLSYPLIIDNTRFPH